MEIKGVLILGGIVAVVVLFFVIAAKGRRAREAASRSATSTQVRTALTKAHEVAADFGNLMERSPLGPTDIADEKALPHPKETLLTAILLLIRITKNQEQLVALQVAAIELAQYQPAVGPAPLRQINLAALRGAMDDPEKMAKTLLEGVDTERWEKFNKRVEADRSAIVRAIQEANAGRAATAQVPGS